MSIMGWPSLWPRSFRIADGEKGIGLMQWAKKSSSTFREDSTEFKPPEWRILNPIYLKYVALDHSIDDHE
jgi:hypothetical protein